MSNPLSLIFMGTPEFAQPILKKLVESEDRVIVVVSQPDRPKGRGQQLKPPPVKTLALEHKLLVLQPEKVREPEFIKKVQELNPELIVVSAFGQILPKELLAIPKLGAINVHASLLPKYRGAGPIQYAILSGETETGISIMQMVEKMDAGPILLQKAIPIEPFDTAGSLSQKLSGLGAELLIEAIKLLKAGKIEPKPQDESQASFAPLLKKDDGKIDWQKSAEQIWRQVRAFNPWPGAFIGEGESQIKIWEVEPAQAQAEPGQVLEAHRRWIEVACGKGSLRIKELQPAGKKRMSAEAFLAGHKIKINDKFPA